MEELNSFELLANRLLFLIGWLINRFRYILVGGNNLKGFDSPILWLTFGLFFAFATLHIFKRLLRKD